MKGTVLVAKFSLATAETHRDKSSQPRTSPNWLITVRWRGQEKLAQAHPRKSNPAHRTQKASSKRGKGGLTQLADVADCINPIVGRYLSTATKTVQQKGY